MKTCDKCGGALFKIEFKVYGIIFTCAQCGQEDRFYFEEYEG
jgi:hypothetical protein